MSGYGKKGGTSKNAGKKATTYTATAPDGTVLTKKSFEFQCEDAFIGAYQHQGVWHAAGVCGRRSERGEPIYHSDPAPGQIALPAKKKNKQ